MKILIDGKETILLQDDVTNRNYGSGDYAIMGKDINDRDCIVARHKLPYPLPKNCKLRTNGHEYDLTPIL